MSAPQRAQVKATFSDGSSIIDAWTSVTYRDTFTDPLADVQLVTKPATTSEFNQYGAQLAKGEQIHLWINGAHQGRFLIEDRDTEIDPNGGRIITVRCHTPLITPYHGAADPDFNLTSQTDQSIETTLLNIFGPYGFSKVTTDARSHVNALTGVPLQGGLPPPFSVGDLKLKNAIAHDGETAYQLAARIVTRLGAVVRIAQDDTLLCSIPVGSYGDTTTPIAYSVFQAATPGSYPGAARFFGTLKVHETNSGQFSSAQITGMRHLGAGDDSASRPVSPQLSASDWIPKRCLYKSTTAPFKSLSYKDKSSRDAQQAQNVALFELGMRAKDAYVVEGNVDGWLDPANGRVWTVDTLVSVRIESLNIAGEPFYVLERTLHQNADPSGSGGQWTSLKLIPKGALILGQKPGGH